MAKDPAERYQSAAEMRTDIQRALSGRPGGRAAADRDVRARARSGWDPATMMAGAAPTGTISPYGTRRGRLRRGRRDGRRRALWWILGAIAALLHHRCIGLPAAARRRREDRAVPSVVGQSQRQAVTAVKKAGPDAEGGQGASSSVKKGTVISPTRSSAPRWRRSSTVTLGVRRAEKVKMPERGRRVGDHGAEPAAEPGPNVTTKTAANSTLARGQVVRQNPRAGHAGEAGQHGHASSCPAAAPRCRRHRRPAGHRQVDPAERGIQGHTVVTAAGPAGSTPGNVFKQNPATGTTAPQGSTVTIFVAATADADHPPPTTPDADADAPPRRTPTPTAPPHAGPRAARPRARRVPELVSQR